MSQTIRGRVCKYDNIAVAQVSGTENTCPNPTPGGGAGVAPPIPLNENLYPVSGVSPYGVEKNAVGVTAPNPERLG
jgi:hypothetical protein